MIGEFGLVSPGKSVRKCAPRLSSRASAQRAISRATGREIALDRPSSSSMAARGARRRRERSRSNPTRSARRGRDVGSAAARDPAVLDAAAPRPAPVRAFAHRLPRARAEHHAFQQRVARQPVGAVHARARDFARRVQPRQTRPAVQIRPHSAHRIMRRRGDRRRLRAPDRCRTAGTSRRSAENAPRAKPALAMRQIEPHVRARPVRFISATIARATTSRGASSPSG